MDNPQLYYINQATENGQQEFTVFNGPLPTADFY